MKYARDTFHICIGFFLGVAFTLGVVSTFNFLVAKYPQGVSLLYDKFEDISQGGFYRNHLP